MLGSPVRWLLLLYLLYRWAKWGPGLEPPSLEVVELCHVVVVLSHVQLFFFLSWRLITLHIVVVFVIHWHESAMDIPVFPIPIPPPTFLSFRPHRLYPARLLRPWTSPGKNYWSGVAMPSSRGSSQPRYRTCVSYISCVGRQVLYH